MTTATSPTPSLTPPGNGLGVSELAGSVMAVLSHPFPNAPIGRADFFDQYMGMVSRPPAGSHP